MRKLKDKHIFVSFEQGTNGYKLGRVLASLPCMHWYSCEENGKAPWNIANSVNKHKFSGITPHGELPPTHDAVEKYMPNEKQYYKLFDELFEKNGGSDIISNGERVIYCTHSMPAKILEYFPNSVIFNIVHEPRDTTNNYIEEIKNTPAYVRYEGIVPEDNEYLKFLEILNGRKEELTLADVWAFERKKKFFEPKLEDKLQKEVYAKVFSNSIFRRTYKHQRVFNTTSRFKPKEIKDWLDSLELE